VGKFVVLKDDKLIEGGVSVSGDTVVVRQGALDRPFPKSQVQYVAASRDEVYKFMLAKVSASDPAGRMRVARWCMYSGLREQALTEAREVQKLKPNDQTVTSLVRSLEQSLKEFPAADSPRMSAPVTPTFPAELTPVVRPMSVPQEVSLPPAPLVPPMPPAAAPVLPTPPAVDAPLQLKPVAQPFLPPAPPAPVAPGPKPVLPPVIPPADPLISVPPPVKPIPAAPVIPPAASAPVVPIPPAAVAPLPPLAPPPGVAVQPPAPVSRTSGQFGTEIPPKPPVAGPSGDEFDPTGFNQQPRK
jgi:hypothetical protein